MSNGIKDDLWSKLAEWRKRPPRHTRFPDLENTVYVDKVLKKASCRACGWIQARCGGREGNGREGLSPGGFGSCVKMSLGWFGLICFAKGTVMIYI